MRVLVATPLYPPDIAPLAEYVRTLAERLSKHHTVTVVTYGRLPVPLSGVSIVAIDKRAPIFTRLYRYTQAFVHSAQKADRIFVMNGASTELPFILASPFLKAPSLFVIGDPAAHQWVKRTILRKLIERTTALLAVRVVATVPPSRPEILPLEEYPVDAFQAYERAWTDHLTTFNI